MNARDIKARKRFRKLRRGNQITKDKRAFVLSRDNFKCRHCGSVEKLSLDHILPLSKGGNSDSSNLQVLCTECNRKKDIH